MLTAVRQADRSELGVPRGATPLVSGRYDADAFGRISEAAARFLGTGRFLVGQTVLVFGWILLNVIGLIGRWDPYPFILLNLAFSLQAAYAAPLILLAQTRQADRDKLRDEALQAHREAEARGVAEFEANQAQVLIQDKALAEQHTRMLEQNTQLTQQVAKLTNELHSVICERGSTGSTGSGRAPTA
jgi:uncharacterized membrane protein